ncbi:hypothetical protein DAPPUDRAFT_253945 [Daphnia pulex]|uniref:Uncharacterized protein n=1 Tax=Daphnia pulex TaxID=6669 RepID=E9H601_DAPPU|nr:hypothetical protein DAPPUDRAFT_253945 [Daphnia pulex]|eukprot:EFX72843.1 hypothetical protein DAPPUDRAFT_253945 [Daphnia pulex]
MNRTTWKDLDDWQDQAEDWSSCHQSRPLAQHRFHSFCSITSGFGCSSGGVVNPGQRIRLKDIAGLSQVPFVLKIVTENTTAGFKKSGIWPFNRNAIPSSQFTPSLVTNRPDQTQPTTTTEDIADEAFAGNFTNFNSICSFNNIIVL